MDVLLPKVAGSYLSFWAVFENDPRSLQFHDQHSFDTECGFKSQTRYFYVFLIPVRPLSMTGV